MSLSYEAFISSGRYDAMIEEQMKRLFGKNPIISDHYGIWHLYNYEVNIHMTDAEFLAIHEKFLRWKESILAFFNENGADFKMKQVDSLLHPERMTGTLYFLRIPVDIDGGIDEYREAMLAFLEKHTSREKTKKRKKKK